MKNNLRNLFIGSSCLALATASVSIAQNLSDQEVSKTTGRFVSTFELNDNYDLRSESLGDALIWTNTLGASLLDRTRTDRFFLDAQGSYRFSDLPTIGQSSTLDDPRIALNYERVIDDNRFDFSANYRRVNNNFFDPLRDVNPDGSFDNVNADVERETFRIGVGGMINEDGPVRLEFDARYRERNYLDVDEESDELQSRKEYFGRTEVGFRVNRQVFFTVGTSYTFRDIDSFAGTNREIRRVDAGLDMDLNERLSARVRLGYSVAESERNSTGRKTTEEGTVGGISFVADMENGQTRGNLSTDIDENGPRSTISLGRLITFANGQLDANIGFSASDTTDVRPVGGISYQYSQSRSEFNVGLRQNTTVDQNSNDVVYTNMNLSYLRRLTPVSSFDFSILGGLTRYENSSRLDYERVTATASYSHSITEDWSVNAGVRHRTRTYVDASDATSNSVFFTLRRDIEALR